MANIVSLGLPAPVLRTIGIENDSTVNISGTGFLTVPLKLSAAGNQIQVPVADVELSLPALLLQATGQTSLSGSTKLVLPAPIIKASGVTGISGSVSLTLPTPVLSAAGPNTAALALPALRLVATGSSGYTGSVGLTLPTPVLAAVGRVPFTANVSLALPTPILSAAGVTGKAAAVSLSLPRLVLAAQGFTGTVGTVTLKLPVLELTATGHGPMIGTVNVELPTLLLQATGYTPVPVVDADGNEIKAIVMNTQTGALSQYTNWHFNSFAAFNGMFLGTSDQGLFALTGDDDNGTLIDAAARLGLSDFGTSFRKRIDRCYVGYRSDGNMILRVVTDETQQRDYMMAAYTGVMNLHGNHVKIGRGVEARYWQFEVRNSQGADFELNMLELKPTKLRRRIGGGDA